MTKAAKFSAIIIMLFTVNFASAIGGKDSISRFTFQRLALEKMRLPIAKCDACGCSASGGSMGFSSMLNSNFVGMRYFNQSYSSRDGIFANSPWVDEHFNTIQVWSRIPLTKKIQVSALVPYQLHFQDRKPKALPIRKPIQLWQHAFLSFQPEKDQNPATGWFCRGSL